MSTAVLLMSYGSPGSLDDVEAYLTGIRGGSPPGPESVAQLRKRYEAVGGSSPLLEITERQAAALERALGEGYRAYVGMKHWHPTIPETVEVMANDGVSRVVALAMAPHFSRMSIGGYHQRLMSAAGDRFEVRMVRHYYDEPRFVGFAAANLRAAMEGFESARVFFTAHSLPSKILAEGDPYQDQLIESAAMVASAALVSDWEFAFQSASETGEPWLGPDLLEALASFAKEGGRRAMVVPIGFTADHLEILYDLDIEAAGRANELGVELRRTPLPNDDPAFIRALAAVVRAAS